MIFIGMAATGGNTRYAISRNRNPLIITVVFCSLSSLLNKNNSL